MGGSCSPVLSGSLLQHQHAPLHPLSHGHLPGGVRAELLRGLPREHHHRLRRLHQHHAVQKYATVPGARRSLLGSKTPHTDRNTQLFNKSVSLRRPAVRRRARGFHRLHRVSQLPWKLPGQRGVYLDHQPSAQAQDPHRCPGDLPAY